MKFNYKHFVIVHGIGDQAPNETALGFMNGLMRALQKAGWRALENNLIESVDLPGPSDPADGSARRRAFRPAFLFLWKPGSSQQAEDAQVVSFSEVYWRPIPDEYIAANGGHLPLPVFAWARSVSERMGLRGAKYHRAQQAIDNVEALLESLRRIAGLRGYGQKMDHVLRQFLGDVEVYTESDVIRGDIDRRFWSVMSRIGIFQERAARELDADLGEPSIYVVAHSEGTVISYYGLVRGALQLAADRDRRLPETLPTRHPPDQRLSALAALEGALQAQWRARYTDASEATLTNTTRASWWLPRVCGFVTLGSPLDKHVAIWSDRFGKRLLDGRETLLEPPVPWYNFWDRSDPVGSGLASLFESREGEEATDAKKLFRCRYDRGFWRYWVPLKAHLDYWRDEDLYRAVTNATFGEREADAADHVRSRWSVRLLLRPLDRVVHLLLRGLTLVAGLYFAARLVDVGKIVFRGWISVPGIVARAVGWLATHSVMWLASVVVPVLLAMLLWNLYVWTGSGGRLEAASEGSVKVWEAAGRVIHGLWRISVVVAGLVLLLAAAAHPWSSLSSFEMRDTLGYLAGVVGAVWVWRIHTRVQRGVLEMWRYGRGAGSAANVGAPDGA